LIEHGVCRGNISDSSGKKQGEITLKFSQEKHIVNTSNCK
jgi:hypothetical protein